MRPTLLVRQVMQAHGKVHIYTNKYDTCRTVKCYQFVNTQDPDLASTVDAELFTAITTALNEAGIKPYSIKWTKGSNFYGCPGLVVRLPL